MWSQIVALVSYTIITVALIGSISTHLYSTKRSTDLLRVPCRSPTLGERGAWGEVVLKQEHLSLIQNKRVYSQSYPDPFPAVRLRGTSKISTLKINKLKCTQKWPHTPVWSFCTTLYRIIFNLFSEYSPPVLRYQLNIFFFQVYSLQLCSTKK